MRIKDLLEMMPKDGWQLDKTGQIRRNMELFAAECPITSLEGLGAPQWERVADMYGLSRQRARLVIYAADTADNDIARLRPRHSWRLRVVRQALLEATGILSRPGDIEKSSPSWEPA
jgi:hypothetical protein